MKNRIDMENGFSETKVSLKLGEETYLVNFGILARRRIEEAHPGFTIFGSDAMPDFEIIPFLIQKGIDPEKKKWTSEEEFLELYESCIDEENLQLVPLAYQNALGFTNQRFAPWFQRASALLAEVKSSETTQI